jgi:hypothetical protein
VTTQAAWPFLEGVADKAGQLRDQYGEDSGRGS